MAKTVEVKDGEAVLLFKEDNVNLILGSDIQGKKVTKLEIFVHYLMNALKNVDFVNAIYELGEEKLKEEMEGEKNEQSE